MIEPRTLGGSDLDSRRLEQARDLLREQPQLSRWKLSRRLAEDWGLYSPKGQLRDMTVRTWLLKMEAAAQLLLPAARRASPNRMRHKRLPEVAHEQIEIREALAQLRPLCIEEVSQRSDSAPLFEWLLHQYHYLSYRSAVGLNLKYLACDVRDRPLACLLFGSAAWKCAPRDRWIGWTDEQRRQRISLITNNTRLLILPWVRVPDLASHLLGEVTARLRQDWRAKYAQEIFLVETFVERDRFGGTCYRAAGWIRVGQTQGRGRQDRQRQLEVPAKDVYLKALCAGWAEGLCQ